MPFCGNFQRSELLDLARLQSDRSDVKARVSRDFDGDKLGGIVLLRQMPEGARQCSLGCVCFSYSKAFSAIGAKHAQEVPAHAANHGIKNRCGDLCHKRPVFGNSIPDRIQTLRQNAPLAQKDGTRVQACARFGNDGACARAATFPG